MRAEFLVPGKQGQVQAGLPVLSLLLSPLSWRSILLKTQAVLYVQQEPYKTNQLIFKSANTSIATSIYRSIKNLDPFLYYKFLQCIFLC